MGRGKVGGTVAKRSGAPRARPLVFDLQGTAERRQACLFGSTDKGNPLNQGTRRAVDDRFVSRTTAALRSWLLTSGPMPFVAVNPVHSCKARPGKEIHSDVAAPNQYINQPRYYFSRFITGDLGASLLPWFG